MPLRPSASYALLELIFSFDLCGLSLSLEPKKARRTTTTPAASETPSSTAPGTLTIINKHRATASERRNATYVGRGSALGNPCKLSTKCPECGRAHGRGETIACFEGYLRRRIREKDPAVCNALNSIWKQVKAGRDVSLMCFCKPKACHADIIAQVIREQL